jgi:2-polyprenyl-3-methyl-5-hydroxy-6-metoxy-1,4-benzoquinol methylase
MKKCPYCKAGGDFYFKIFSRTYNRCSECDLIYKQTQDSYDKILTHYREDYFDRYHSDQIEGSRNKLFNHILDLIEENRGIGRLLDVGTGCGFFPVAAQKRGWEVKGIEPSNQSVEVAQREYGLDVFKGTLREYDVNDQFDVITFINVLDHSAEPWEEVKRAVNLLNPGGIVYFRFPNGLLHTQTYRLASKFGLADLSRRFLVFHEFSFTPGFIRRLWSDQGFGDIEVYNASLSGGSLISSFHIVSFAIRSIEAAGKLTDLISGGRVLWGPSLEVIAGKK